VALAVLLVVFGHGPWNTANVGLPMLVRLSEKTSISYKVVLSGTKVKAV
jgi:hypothetical protein